MRDNYEFNIQFVQLVRSYPCLYDNTRRDYAIKDPQEVAWRNVANAVQESVQDCKDRWKNLRGRYLKYVKTKNTAGAKCTKEYYLAEYMSFLDGCFRLRRRPKKKLPSIDLDDETSGSGLNGGELLNEVTDGDADISNHNILLSPSTLQDIKIEAEDRNGTTSYFIGGKRKKTDSECNEDDPDLLFLKSLLPDMSCMNTEQKRKFKIGVLTLADQVLGINQENNEQV